VAGGSRCESAVRAASTGRSIVRSCRRPALVRVCVAGCVAIRFTTQGESALPRLEKDPEGFV